MTLEGLTKVYPDGTVALQGLDLHVDAGEFMVLERLHFFDPATGMAIS